MIVVGVPTYDETVHNQLMLALMNEQVVEGTPRFTVISNHSSLLARGFNELYCFALNNRPQVTHFLMVHADVVPEAGFIGAMAKTMKKKECGVLSVLLPLKDNRGLTSTALDGTEGERRRLSLAEAALLPEAFSKHDVAQLFGADPAQSVLLANSGLMLVDVRQDFAEQCWYNIYDFMVKTEKGFEPRTESEDWYFSRRAQELGARVFVTQRVKARHVGRMSFPNWGVWGSHNQDDADVSVLAKEAVDA